MHPQQDIALRTRSFAIDVMKMTNAIGRSRSSDILATQVIRSATSVGANYREARRARSRAEFISKTTVSLQEMEETRYWLELIETTGLADVTNLIGETDEILALLSASVATAKRNARAPHP